MGDFSQLNPWILTILTFFPLLGAIIVAILPRSWSRGLAVAAAVANFVFSLHLLAHWQMGAAQMQFEYSVPWLPQFGVNYHLGVDGIAMPLVLLTTFLTPLVLLGAWSQIETRVKEFSVVALLLQSALIGVFAARDVILFYIFWEAVLIPMYLMIGVWGGAGRARAAIKFFLYTMAGSVLMWVAMLYGYFMQPAATRTFDYDAFAAAMRALDGQNGTLLFGVPASYVLFGAFAIAFMIKVPVVPLHTWQADTYAAAPTPGTVLLAAVLSKMGIYGFIRFAVPLFPNAATAAAPLLIVLSLIGIIYGALIAIRQTDLKRVIAYASISHLGFIVLGVFVALRTTHLNDVALAGATLQMVSHGLTTAALFLLIGMLIERRQTGAISAFGGAATQMPRFTVMFWIALFASIGLPGLSGFVGEYLILQGAMAAHFVYAFAAAIGVILGAIYMLKMFGNTMFGVKLGEGRVLPDVNVRVTFTVAAILVFIVWIGIAPQGFLNVINPSARAVAQRQDAAYRVPGLKEPYSE
jgi:NADH-quinone oxidoreductase subunit M